MDMQQLKWRFEFFDRHFQLEFPQLHTHFEHLKITLDMYYIDWYVYVYFQQIVYYF